MTGAVSIGYFDAEHDTTTQYGHVDIENGVRADERSVYEWGSTTKLLVWVAIMQLEDQGRLDRSDQVSDHLEGTGLTFEKSFTLQDLMDHRAGFAEIAYPRRPPTLQDFLTFGRALLPDTDGPRALFDDPATLTELFSGSTHYAGTQIVRSSNGCAPAPG